MEKVKSMNTIYTCGIKINPINVDEISSLAEQWLNEGKKGFQITGVNLEQMALLSKQPDFSEYINASNIVNIDGIVVYWYLKLKRFKLSQRTLCADILYSFLHSADKFNRRIFLLGATQETVEMLVDKIHNNYPNIQIVGYHNGFFSDEKQIVEEVAKVHPDYLFIGMPSPFKERFISTYKSQLNTGICFGVGGMFDIMAGKVQRAPEKIQKMGLEWLYRITQNPLGHSKRIMRALLPCLKIFLKHLFEPRRQTIYIAD